MRLSERSRAIAAWAGMALWCGYPVAFTSSMLARHDGHCASRHYTGVFDECFNDDLSVVFLPLFALLGTVVLAYPFARLAFQFFAPPLEERTGRWKLGGTSAASEGFPTFQYFAAIGMVWAILHWIGIPLWVQFFPLHLYWAGWVCWFFLGALVSWPLRADR